MLGLLGLGGSALIAPVAEAPEVTGALSGASPDAAIASKLQQLAALNSDMASSDCDFAVDPAIIEACDQLSAQAKKLAAEIDGLRPLAVADAALSKAPPQPKPYTFKTLTNPAMSYRTFCVRECDGYYYPLSEASMPGAFITDEAKCQSSCSSPAELFYSVIPGEDAGQMVALTGERYYAKLANAFRYRSEYVDGCACKPKPWSTEAKAVFDRRAVIATRTWSERLIATGAAAAAKVLAAPEAKIAAAPAHAKARYSQAVSERPRFRPFFRPFRDNAGVQAANEPPQQRRFFLFRNR